MTLLIPSPYNHVGKFVVALDQQLMRHFSRDVNDVAGANHSSLPPEMEGAAHSPGPTPRRSRSSPPITNVAQPERTISSLQVVVQLCVASARAVNQIACGWFRNHLTE